MTRDEAFNKLVNASDEWNQEQQQILNEIYDDLESRTCENCKYFIQMGWTDFGNKCISDKNRVTYTSIDFGCNKFERKKD